MNIKAIVTELNAAGAEMRDCCNRLDARDKIEAEMLAMGFTRRADGVWMMSQGAGLAPAKSIYEDHAKGYTLD